jgi:hypothetical protein
MEVGVGGQALAGSGILDLVEQALKDNTAVCLERLAGVLQKLASVMKRAR